MTNRRTDPVTYQRFEAQPLLSEGLLGVSRDNGDLERKVAIGMARAAGYFADEAARQAGAQARAAGEAAASKPVSSAVAAVRNEDGSFRVYTGSGIDQAKALLRDEEGFRPQPYWDVNAYRTGYGSDTVTLADGRSVRVAEGMTTTRDDAERDLDYRLSAREGAQVRRQLGRAFDALPANVQGALYSVGYNYGSLPDTVLGAARTGDIGAIADAVAALPANPDRRRREAAFIRGGGAAAGASEAGGALGPASVGAPSVTPVAHEGFRPRKGGTIYDTAYNVAGTKAYLENLKLTMLEDQTKVYEAYQDDPAMLEKALGELETAHLSEHVFPEIEAEFRQDFRRMAIPRVAQARRAAAQRAEEQNRSTFLSGLGTFEERKAQALVSAAEGDQGATLVLEQLQNDIDAQYDSAVARGIVTPDQASAAKKQSRDGMIVGLYAGQAARKPAERIAAMRAELTDRWRRGEEPEIDAGNFAKIDAELASAESARRTQDDKADADLTRRGDDLAKRVARGLAVTPQELARFQLDAGTAPNGKAIVGSTLSRLRVSQAIRTQPIDAVEKNLPALIGEGARPEDVDFARKAVAEHRADLRNDPLGVAERFGVLPVSPGLPLDGDIDPSAVSASFAERINAARSAAAHFGVTPKFFRPGEAEAVETAVRTDPDRGLDIAAGLVDAAGADADRVLGQLNESAPAVSLAGGLIAAGGNRQAALDLIGGFSKGPDGKSYPDMPNTKRLPAAQGITGKALAYAPSEINRLDRAAAAIARKRLADGGIDPKKDEAKDIYARAYQEAAGATFVGDIQFGGFADYDRGAWYSADKVLIPPSIRADRFPRLMEALTDADVGQVRAKNGRVWTAGDFRKAVPVAVQGGFAFALGDPAGPSPMFIADEQGAPVVIDLAGMRPTLEPRVPGAFR